MNICFRTAALIKLALILVVGVGMAASALRMYRVEQWNDERLAIELGHALEVKP